MKSGLDTTVTFKLNSYDFTFIDQNGKRVAEDGLFTIEVGKLKGNFTLKNANPTTPATTNPSKITTTTSNANIFASSINSVLNLVFGIFLVKQFF